MNQRDVHSCQLSQSSVTGQFKTPFSKRARMVLELDDPSETRCIPVNDGRIFVISCPMDVAVTGKWVAFSEWRWPLLGIKHYVHCITIFYWLLSLVVSILFCFLFSSCFLWQINMPINNRHLFWSYWSSSVWCRIYWKSLMCKGGLIKILFLWCGRQLMDVCIGRCGLVDKASGSWCNILWDKIITTYFLLVGLVFSYRD